MDREQKNILAESALSVVDKITVEMMRRFNYAIEKNEIRSYALSGLAHAVENFDNSKKVPFSAFARPRIRGAIYDGLAENSILPRRILRKIEFYKKTEEQLTFYNQIDTPRDKTDSINRLADRLQELATSYVVMTSLNDDVVQNEEELNPEELLEQKHFSILIKSYVDKLPEPHREIIYRYYFKNQSLSDISEDLEHTPSWASRVIQVSLKKLKKIILEAEASPD
ncbi:MAG: sigma-70 family RNA polymerase sigma factor [Deltaproteobacteria bacterium]|nr:sigma-70 family RNA polymerase sigma factor [Deltaproteobacteria bacterium]